MSLVGSAGYRWINNNGPIGDLKFKSKPASKIVTARVAQQIAMQLVEAEVNKLFPRLQREMTRKIRETALAQTDDNAYRVLIRDGENVSQEYGSHSTSDSKGTIVARDYLGRRVPDALIMHYTLTGDTSVTYKFPKITNGTWQRDKQNILQKMIENSGHYSYTRGKEDTDIEQEITTKDVVHIDLNPQVSLSTNKNVVMTTVQGRDFTRKELISGGDLTFTINGNVVSDLPNTYPTAAVQRLINMMQYKGIVYVNHYLFGQFNVKSVIIKDFSLGAQEFKNIQPYSMTCVAIETDDVQVINDTITKINQEIQLSPLNFWYNLILNNKLAEIAAGVATSAANSAVSQGLDIENMVTNL